MAARMHRYSDPSYSVAPGSLREVEGKSSVPDAPKGRGGALRGLMFAAALATPFWVVLYMLLR